VYICDENNEKPKYSPGLERWSMYKNLWIRHWEGFQKIYSNRFSGIYGYLTKANSIRLTGLSDAADSRTVFKDIPVRNAVLFL